MTPRGLFGSPGKRHAKVHVFHDESEPVPNRGWLLLGLLFVPSDSQESVLQRLREPRAQEECEGEIHFCRLPRHFEGPYGAKARVVRRWFQMWQRELHQFARFLCLAVDRSSPAFCRDRFAQPHHVYNRFTAMALKAGIAYFYPSSELDTVEISFVSDEKERKSSPDPARRDNFIDYIINRVEIDNSLDANEGTKQRPTVTRATVTVTDSSTNDLLQLTDSLLGATQAALAGRCSRATKKALASMLIRWAHDVHKPPYKQELGLHRCLSISGFPSENGGFISPLPFAMTGGDDQRTLAFD